MSHAKQPTKTTHNHSLNKDGRNPSSILKTTNYKLKTTGFTLVELLTTLTILVVIAIIGFTYANNYKLTQYNVKRTADMGNLIAASASYYEVNKKYPNPDSNNKYYDSNGTYSHSSSGAYGVSGFATSEIFGKQFLATAPMDPQTNNFYAYAKTLSGTPTYQFATSLDKEGTYYAYVKGNYSGEDLAGLIKEYNGPNFVIDKSAKYLPYNPTEVKLTAKITSYSGTINIDGDTTNLDKTVSQGNTINVMTGGLATIYLSDGSELKLGSTTKTSTLVMSDLEYTDDSNLVTKVMLKLSIGEIWVKAPALGDGSELVVETDNAAASVRGTVFGVEFDGPTGTGTIELIVGKVQVNSVSGGNLTNNIYSASTYFSLNTGSQLYQENSNYFIQVKEGEIPVKLVYSNIYLDYLQVTGTGTIEQPKIDSVMNPQIELNEGYIPKINKIVKTQDSLSIELDNPGANWAEIYTNNGEYTSSTIDSSTGTISLTNTGTSYTGELAIRLCAVPTKGGCSVNLDTSLSPISFNFIPQANANASQETAGSQVLIDRIFSEDSTDYDVNLHTIQKFYPSNSYSDNKITIVNSNSGGLCTPTLVCSQFKKIHISEGDVSYDLTDPSDKESPVCNGLTYTESGASQPSCESGTGLVAYAPYNVAGDLNMYISGGTLLYVTSSGITNNTTQVTDITYSNTGPSFVGGTSSGIVVNTTTKDFIKYDLSSLNLGKDFAIEMSVIGAALKRSGSLYYLFNTSSGMYGELEASGDLSFGHSNTKATISSGSLNSLKQNRFYTIRFTGEDSGYRVSIPDISLEVFTGATVQMGTGLWVGSSSNTSSNYQWNDIIDSVKIYNISK